MFHEVIVIRQQPMEEEILRQSHMLAAYAGCFLTRECSRIGFQKHCRSMLTSDMLQEVGNVFQEHFES